MVLIDFGQNAAHFPTLCSPWYFPPPPQMHMRLFRAQRNFYISGFALFLCLVIRRLVALISTGATLEAEKEAAMKQATSASR